MCATIPPADCIRGLRWTVLYALAAASVEKY